MYESYKKHTGNLQQEAAGHLVVAHILMQLERTVSDLQDTIQEASKNLQRIEAAIGEVTTVIDSK